MSSVLKKLYSKVGLDSSIVFFVLTKIVQSVGGVVTLLLIVRFLNKNEQGYNYTFWSILAIQVFFEMGLTTIVTQYIAHEAAHLTWKDKSSFEGDEYYSSRLAHIVKLSVKWFLAIAGLMFFVLFFAGSYFFTHYNNELNVSWQTPWLIISTATSGILVLDLFFAILEGLGKIKEITKLRLVQQLINLTLVYSFLFSGFKLLSGGLALLISSIITALILYFTGYATVIKSIWLTPVKHKVHYRSEILPYQVKIGLGYMSGFFIYQIINPVLFATQGPIIAGQMGATQSVLNGILVMSLSWVTTKVALFSNLVAKNNFVELNKIYTKNTKISATVCTLGISAFLVILWLLNRHYHKIGDRFLNYTPVMFLGLTQIASVIGSSQGYYLRSFKKEPFFIPSIVMGILSAASTLILSRSYGINGISMGYFIINGVVGFIWGCLIFKNKKHEWTGA